MHNKIGEYIINLAATILILGMIASALAFFIIVGQDIDNFGRGLLIAALGGLCSWVSFLMLSGFASLVENTTKMVELLSKGSTVSKFTGTYEKASSVVRASENNSKADENEVGTKSDEQETCFAQQNSDSCNDEIYKIIDDSEITEEEKKNIKELISWKNDGVITTQECRNRISKILSNYSIAIQFRFLNKL